MDKIDDDIYHIYESLRGEWYLSLDQKLYMTYKELNENITFKEFKNRFLDLFKLDELDYYTSAVYPELKDYTKEKLKLNRKIVTRALAINETFYTCNPYNNTLLDIDMLYAASIFYNSSLFTNNDFINTFFTNSQKKEIDMAIKDFYTDTTRNEYGRVLKDASKSIDIEDILRKEYQENKNISLVDLRDKYDEYNPLELTYPDKIYYNCVLKDLRNLLSDEERFVKVYKKANNIK